jgi:hypothetical protein
VAEAAADIKPDVPVLSIRHRVCCSPACSLIWRSRKWGKAHPGT